MYYIQGNLLQAVISYLAHQPYGEVARLVNGLSTLAEVPEEGATIADVIELPVNVDGEVEVETEEE